MLCSQPRSPVERVEGGLDCPPLQTQLPSKAFNHSPAPCSPRQAKLSHSASLSAEVEARMS